MSAQSSSSADAAHAPEVQRTGMRVPAWVFLAAIVLLAGLWALDRWVFHLSVLTTFRGTKSASPLYAFWNPSLRVEALAFVALGAGFVLLAPRIADPGRASRAVFLAVLALAGIALPLALFWARQDLHELGAPFRVYQNEEFWDDALKIPLMQDASGRSGVSVFLRHYVEAMPRLSLHGQHFPPGHALFLHASNAILGAKLVTAALVVLCAAATGLVVAFLALRELLGEHAARQGALLLASLPPFLDFACTSMDAVFFLWATLGLWLSLRALRADARLPSALLAGASLGVAALASFAALPLGLLILVYAAVLAARRGRTWSTMTRQVGAIGVGFALFLGAFWLVTGFAWWDCVLHARESGLALMTKVLKSPPSSRWAELSYGNLAAYLIYAGPGVVALLLARLATRRSDSARAQSSMRDSWTPTVLITLLVMATGGLFFMETERIWLFTLPWLVGVVFTSGVFHAGSLRPALGFALGLALLLEAQYFTLW